MKLPNGCWGIDPAMVKRPCAVGIDIRPGSWDVLIGDVNRNVRGALVPRLVFGGKLEDEEQVAWLMPKYGVVVGVEDSRPETTLAERLQKKLKKIGINMWRSSYLTTPGDIKVQENTAEGILRIERTMSLNDVQHAVGTGGLALPQNYRAIYGGKFVDELISSTCVPKIINGREWLQWVNSGPDHTMHALNYLLIAIEIGRLAHYGTEATMGATDGVVSSTFRKNVRTLEEDDLYEDIDEDSVTWSA